MVPIPRILHFVTPDAPSPLSLDRIERVKSLHPDWATHIWSDSRPPAGGRLSHFYGKATTGAQVADLMRIDAIWAYGGVYIDTDFDFHRPLDDLAEAYSFFIASEDGNYLTNAVFGAPPGHPALDAIIDFLLENEPDWSRPPNRTTGPHLFTAMCRWRSDIDVLPRETFYPYGWDEPPRAAHRLTYGTHLCEGSWLPPDARHGSAAAITPGPSQSRSALGRRAQVEVAKLLSTIGLKEAGATLWNKAHGFSGRDGPAQEAIPAAESRAYSVGDEVFVQTQHGTILVCDGRDLSITPHLALRGYDKWAEERFLQRTLTGGDWFVDVGAGIGNHAMLAATRVGPFGRIFAFEPNPRCAHLLRRSAVLNRVHDRLRLAEIGVSEQIGDAELMFSPSLLGDGALASHRPSGATAAATSDTQALTIPTTTLDAAFPAALPIKILKIAAEGHEPAILRGGARLLADRSVDFLMCEARHGAIWQEHIAAFETLVAHGYKAARLSADGSLVRHATLDDALLDDASCTLIFHVS